MLAFIVKYDAKDVILWLQNYKHEKWLAAVVIIND